MATYWRHRTRDFLGANPLIKAAAAHFVALKAKLERNPTRRLQKLARAAHLCPERVGADRLRSKLADQFERLSPADVDWSVIPGVSARTDLPKAIILKPPVSEDERGVLHVAFEDQWLRLLRSGQAAAIGRRYDLLLGPSWSLPPDLAMLLAGKLWPNPVFTLLSHLDDAATISDVTDRIIPVPLLASHWVHPDPFDLHVGRPRVYDIVMLANFGTFKRHWLFFDTLRQLPRNYRVLLLGVPLGDRNGATIREEARSFGVADRFDLVVKPTRAQIVEGLCRAKVSLIFSRMEGSCIAVAESLLADTPVGLFRGARIGSSAFINEWTGRLLAPRGLARQIEQFVGESPRYRARSWAMEHISCFRSAEVLNDTLRMAARRQGRPWTRDAVPMQNDLVPSYLDADTASEMAAWNDDFLRRFGLRIGAAAASSPAPVPANVA